MRSTKLWLVLVGITTAFFSQAAPAQTAQAVPALSEQDKTDIQALVAGYARALAGCAADEYADLFAPGSGYFASGFRGQVSGRERLIAMVQSERQCSSTPGAAPAARPANVPKVSIEQKQTGIYGLVDLGTAGHYEDEYVKTPKGWKFAARTVITPAEKTAGLNAVEMRAIRAFAGGPQDAPDFWAPAQDGVKRFRSAGVVIAVSNGAVTGRVYLKDGGRYDDVYEKSAEGYWRFKSRVYAQ